MGKKSSSPPPAPDPRLTIAAQSAANSQAVRESARVNAVDQYGPWGATTFQRNRDGTPASQTVTLEPGGQRVFDNQVAMAGTLSQKANELAGRVPTGPMDVSGLPAMTGRIARADLPALPGVGDFGAERRRVEDAVYDRGMGLLAPGLRLERERLEQSLADRGIPMDSAAGEAALDRLDRMQGERAERLALSAVMAGGDEQSRLFGLASGARGQLFDEGTSDATFGNQARGQALSEALMLRNQPFNEAAALIQGSPAMQQPGFQGLPAYNVAPADVAGITQQDYANRLGAWQTRQQQRAGLWNGLLGLGTSALKAGMGGFGALTAATGW